MPVHQVAGRRLPGPLAAPIVRLGALATRSVRQHRPGACFAEWATSAHPAPSAASHAPRGDGRATKAKVSAALVLPDAGRRCPAAAAASFAQPGASRKPRPATKRRPASFALPAGPWATLVPPAAASVRSALSPQKRVVPAALTAIPARPVAPWVPAARPCALLVSWAAGVLPAPRSAPPVGPEALEPSKASRRASPAPREPSGPISVEPPRKTAASALWDASPPWSGPPRLRSARSALPGDGRESRASPSAQPARPGGSARPWAPWTRRFAGPVPLESGARQRPLRAPSVPRGAGAEGRRRSSVMRASPGGGAAKKVPRRIFASFVLLAASAPTRQRRASTAVCSVLPGAGWATRAPGSAAAAPPAASFPWPVPPRSRSARPVARVPSAPRAPAPAGFAPRGAGRICWAPRPAPPAPADGLAQRRDPKATELVFLAPRAIGRPGRAPPAAAAAPPAASTRNPGPPRRASASRPRCSTPQSSLPLWVFGVKSSLASFSYLAFEKGVMAPVGSQKCCSKSGLT